MALYVLMLEDGTHLPAGGPTLPESWQRYLQGKTHPKKQRQSCRGYALLAAALKWLQPEAPLPELQFSEGGKPCLAGDSPWHFSLSHSGGVTVLALSDRPVGIDCEQLRPAPPRLKAAFGSGLEEDFWRSWTGREALGKLRGCGIAGLCRGQPELLPQERLHFFSEIPGYALCLARMGEEKPLFYPAAKLWDQ